MVNSTVYIFGVVAPSGVLLRDRVRNPDGTTAGEFALTENLNGSGAGTKTYGGSASLALADATSGAPYTHEVRQVATQDTAGFDASVTVRAGPSVLGWVSAGVIYDNPVVLTPVVLPLAATLSATSFAIVNLPELAAGAAPLFTWTVTDASGAPVNLSSKTVRLVAFSNGASYTPAPFTPPAKTLFKYETGGTGITISGASSNVVNVQHAASNTASLSGELGYWLWNVTDNVALARGRMPVVPAVSNT